jgi:hypothetical protein
MGIKRIVDVDFWNDEKTLEQFTPEDKLFMLYLMTNPHTKQLGIYKITAKQISFELGYTIEAVNTLIDRFENKYNLIIYSQETREIAILDYLEHSIVKGGKPVEDCIKKEMKEVKNKILIKKVFDNIKDIDSLNITIMNIIKEYENKNVNEKDNENDNDNDNERFVHDSSKIQVDPFAEYYE